MRKQRSNTLSPQTPSPKRRRVRRLLLILSSCFALVLIGASIAYVYLRPQPSVVHPRKVIAGPTFRPVVGDVNDPEVDDDDITVQQSLVPAFQFKRGGYTISGTVLDARSKQPVFGAVVWIDLLVQEGQPTTIPLNTVTDASGKYEFIHIAQGSYTLVASRYYNIGDNRYYAERIFSSVVLTGNRSGVTLPLTAISIVSHRSVLSGRAKNVILLDLRGFYAASLLDDPLLLDETRNFRAFLQHATVQPSLWLPYGWRPLDQYALLTGSYPQWATYDPWPHVVPWGMPDNIDTTFWLTGGREAHLFGQESIFDVAKSYGMQTGVVTSSDYLLSDATTRSLDLLQRSSTFTQANWLTQMKQEISSGQTQSNGFLVYSELAPLSVSDTTSSPDAQGDDYQQALLLADQTFGQLLTWLSQQGLLQNTLIALTTSQAEANHSFADNFYGMGGTGQGTSKQTLLALSGPGQCTATIQQPGNSAFIIAPTLMHAIGLPAPAEARIPFVPSEPMKGDCA
ncbi:MAG: carboxypeptidase regulatory-like domain-containing protein [Ktedonobacteraceae bacterium]